MKDNRIKDVVILDLRKKTDVCQFFVIGTVTSARQMSAVSQKLADEVSEDRRVVVCVGLYGVTYR